MTQKTFASVLLVTGTVLCPRRVKKFHWFCFARFTKYIYIYCGAKVALDDKIEFLFRDNFARED